MLRRRSIGYLRVIGFRGRKERLKTYESGADGENGRPLIL